MPDWRTRCRNNSSPYTSTIVFLVRKGNPKGINDWGDLVKDGVEVITPNPKTSGGARWNYLAAWAWANNKFGGDEAKVKDFIAKLYSHVPVLDTGARGSTMTFAQQRTGRRAARLGERGLPGARRIRRRQVRHRLSRRSRSWPSRRSRWSTPMSTPRARARWPRPISNILYSEEGQTIVAKHHYRPSKPELVPADELAKLPEDQAGHDRRPAVRRLDEGAAHHFGDGGVFDQIYKPAQ